METLSNFPASILDHIIGNRSSSWLIFKLWLCGDRILNEKLAHGLTYVRLVAKARLDSKFPRLLSKLRGLRYLSINARREIKEEPSDWPNIISSLTGSLETLKLSFLESHRCLMNFGPATPTCASKPIYTIYERGSCEFIDIGRIFPRLHTLTLDKVRGQPLNFAAALPSTLTSLSGFSILTYITGEEKYMSTLPRSLLRWKGGLTIRGARNSSRTVDLPLHHADWRDAPPNLERIPRYFVSMLDDKDHSWLPRSLCEGQIPFVYDVTFSSDVARTLPPLTYGLDIRKIDKRINTTNWLSELPKALKSLNIQLPSAVLNSLAYLPRTLTKLQIVCKEQDSFDLRSLVSNAKVAETFWPPSLDDLEWDSALPCDDFDLFPKSTRDLTVRLADLSSDTTTKRLIIDAKLFPPKLTSLSLMGGSSPSTTIIGQYPSGLRRIDTSLLRYGLDERTIESLPDSLTKLILGERTVLFDPIELYFLPKSIPCNLASLQVFDWATDHFGLVPRTLKDLKVDNLIAPNEQSTIVAAGRMFEGLPVSLTSLQIDSSTCLEIPLQRVSHLVNLRLLHLNYTEEMSALALRELPPFLTDLSLPIDELADEDASFIPPGLTRLSLGDPCSLIITPSIVQYWPLRATDDLIGIYHPPEEHFRAKVKASCNPYSH